MPEADFANILIAVGLPESFVNLLANSDVKASEGALYSEDKTLAKLIGRPTTPFATVIEKFVS